MIFRFDLNEEYSERLLKEAEAAGLSVQDYIRARLFGEEMETVFTERDAVRRIREKNLREFTLPEIYGDEWSFPRGKSGVIGRRFYNYITEHPELGIRFKDMGKYGRIATYLYEPK